MANEIAEYEIGKRHLANIMGEDPDTFRQDDINVCIQHEMFMFSVFKLSQSVNSRLIIFYIKIMLLYQLLYTYYICRLLLHHTTPCMPLPGNFEIRN